VRDALELSAAAAVFDNAAEWQAELNKAIAHIAAKLVPKLPAHQITAQFYKMVRVKSDDSLFFPGGLEQPFNTICFCNIFSGRVRKGWSFRAASGFTAQCYSFRHACNSAAGKVDWCALHCHSCKFPKRHWAVTSHRGSSAFIHFIIPQAAS